jgi:hypothetical protein
MPVPGSDATTVAGNTLPSAVESSTFSASVIRYPIVRTSPFESITTPVPSRCAPSVVALRASRTARLLIFTTESASTVSSRAAPGVPGVAQSGCAPKAGVHSAKNAPAAKATRRFHNVARSEQRADGAVSMDDSPVESAWARRTRGTRYDNLCYDGFVGLIRQYRL